MCTGAEGPAIPSGELIAIIRPIQQTSSQQNVAAAPSYRLRFSNHDSDRTISELRCDSAPVSADVRKWEVRIHKYGYPMPSYLPDKDAMANPVVHSLSHDGTTMTFMSIGKLDLGTGGNGVVGRTVSVLDGRNQIVGEGIIGWS